MCKLPKLNLRTPIGFKWSSPERTLDETVSKHFSTTTINLDHNNDAASFYNFDIFLSNQLYIFYKNLFSYGKTAAKGLF